jgi:hypothetical protein
MHRWRVEFVLVAMCLATAIGGFGCRSRPAGGSASNDGNGGIEIILPASLEAQRNFYSNEIDSASLQVVEWFNSNGFTDVPRALIRKAIVFDTRETARSAVAAAFGTDTGNVPATFSGTVNDSTLYVVSPEIYKEIWVKLYPGWQWSHDTYRSLLVHELTHRAHALVCRVRFGTEDAMGPNWFFEGLAMHCAGQFPVAEGGQQAFSDEEMQNLIGPGKTPPVSYPVYARIVGTLAQKYSLHELILRAREKDFPFGNQR